MSGTSSKLAPTEEQKAADAKLKEVHLVVRAKQAAVNDMKSKMYRCNFRYSPPEPNFDSNRVMGTVCSLINKYDPQFSIALEVTAGDQLYSVVVDSEETSMLLMSAGNLPKHINFIPLNQIQASVIQREHVQAAQEIAGGAANVKLALDLITYDVKYEPVMKMLFGKTLICKTLPMAIKLAYHPGLHYRVITEDGDDINPDGVLTGGAPPEGGALAQRAALETLLLELEQAKEEFAECIKCAYK